MADTKQGGLYAAIFAAGLAAGGGGSEVLRDPDPLSYMAAGIAESVSMPCETLAKAETCEQHMRWVHEQIRDDIAEDANPQDAVTLGRLDQYVMSRVEPEDVVWELRITDMLTTINRRLADGYAAKEITPDDSITAEQFLAMLGAANG